jgi:hypothetical protein
MSRKSNHAATISRSEENFGKPEVNFLGAQPDTGAVDNMKLMDVIAKSRMIIRNIAYPKAREIFPFDPVHQTIERFFPLADGGPLYVDTAEDDRDLAACEKKRVAMQENGSRYLVLTKNTDMVDAMNQLGM